MTVLLSVQELTKSFGPRPLFADLSLDLRAGERVGLIGPNGAGKSTLLRLLAGLEEPDAGDADRSAAAPASATSPRTTSSPPARPSATCCSPPSPTSTLEEHERETRAAITLTQVGFADPDQPAAALSGGWRKRLALARELVRRPDLLLLDEPTNHLDLPGIVWLERLLRAAPFGYLVATHDRAFLRAVADEVIEISRVYPGGSFRAAGVLRRVRRAARGVPRSPGPAAGGGRQPGAPRDGVARPQGVGPAAQVGVAHRRGRPTGARSWPS